MAKKSAVEKNNRRKKMAINKTPKREALKAIMRNQEVTFEERMNAVHKMAEMPRNSSRVRHRNRCSLTGRPRGYYRKFEISRIALRELGSSGLLPGIIKASW